MQRIVVRHLTGSKANQVEEFPLNHFNEVIFGRDPSAAVKYDPDRDDLVSSLHAKIAPDPANPNQFVLTDLSSRNGTFLNKQRIVGMSKITPGDSVQLGPGGPEFKFDLEPRSMSTVKGTRSAEIGSLDSTVQGASAVPQTRQVDLGVPSTRSVSLASPGSGTSSTGTVGKATVERMISQNIAITKRTEGRRYMMIGGSILGVLIIAFGAIAAYLYFSGNQIKSQLASSAANAPMDSAAIAKAGRTSVVQIDVAWKLISSKGHLVYHEWNSTDGFRYILLSDGKTIEPMLTTNENLSLDKKPIHGEFTASGVVVSNDGFILTSHHVAAAWETPFNIPDNAQRGTLFDRNYAIVRRINLRDEANFEWVPSETQQDIYQDKGHKVKEGKFNGTNDRLIVSFPGATEGNNAREVKASDAYDVAMIKVDLPGTLPKADLFDSLDSVKQGEPVYVMGYPFSSLSMAGSKREIPEPTMSGGNIGKLIRAQEKVGRRQVAYSKIGDAFQLSVNTSDTGYDGAPVFDARARVIGIFNINKSALDSPVTVAVPIRYGIELMSVGGSSK